VVAAGPARAVELGFGVVFYRLEDLLTALKRDAELPTRRLRGKKRLSHSPVIIDEVRFKPMTRQEDSLFLRLVSHRHRHDSILITTIRRIRDWPEVLVGDGMFATANLDRRLHNSHVLDIKTRSARLRDLERAVTHQGS
jgi:DNA replication protein DnaC